MASPLESLAQPAPPSPSTRSAASIIADGIHLHPADRTHGSEGQGRGEHRRSGDRRHAAGGRVASHEFSLLGRHITVRDGACRLDNGTLAGSVLTMDQALRNVVEWTGLPLHERARHGDAAPRPTSSALTRPKAAWRPERTQMSWSSTATSGCFSRIVGGRVVYHSPDLPAWGGDREAGRELLRQPHPPALPRPRPPGDRGRRLHLRRPHLQRGGPPLLPRRRGRDGGVDPQRRLWRRTSIPGASAASLAARRSATSSCTTATTGRSAPTAPPCRWPASARSAFQAFVRTWVDAAVDIGADAPVLGRAAPRPA